MKVKCIETEAGNLLINNNGFIYFASHLGYHYMSTASESIWNSACEKAQVKDLEVKTAYDSEPK